jgi:hypothetical protein
MLLIHRSKFLYTISDLSRPMSAMSPVTPARDLHSLNALYTANDNNPAFSHSVSVDL